MALRARRRPDSPSSRVRICKLVAELRRFRHPRCPGPNGAPAPTGPAAVPPPPPPVPPLPPELDEASTGVELEDPPEEPVDDSFEEVTAVADWDAWLVVLEFDAAPVTRAREACGRGRAPWPLVRCVPRDPLRLEPVEPRRTIPGAVGSIAAGLSPSGVRPAYVDRRPAGPSDPMTDATTRNVASAAPAIARARGRRTPILGTRARGSEIGGTRTRGALNLRTRGALNLGTRGALSRGSRARGSGRGGGEVAASGTSGACIAS